MKNLLKIKNLRKIYHTKDREILAVDNFSFELLNGEFITIVGPSGCGKSTILSILCGLEKKSSGHIKISDNIKLGYMLQKDCLFDWLTIYENCLIGLRISKNDNKKNQEYVKRLLKTYGLYEFKDTYPNNLSGGMRQRVALIRTLATKPDILLLDEPYSALDYQTRLAVSDDVYKIIKKEGKSAIMVSHDIAESISVSDRIIVMSKRPSKIKKIFDVKLNNKSTPIENRKDKNFSKYYDLIWKEIDYHV